MYMFLFLHEFRRDVKDFGTYKFRIHLTPSGSSMHNYTTVWGEAGKQSTPEKKNTFELSQFLL